MKGSIGLYEGGVIHASRVVVRCPECGLDSRSRACHPALAHPVRWCVFALPKLLRKRGCSVATFFRLLLPFIAWRGLTMSTPVDGPRIKYWVLGYIVVSLLVMDLLYCALMAFTYGGLNQQIGFFGVFLEFSPRWLGFSVALMVVPWLTHMLLLVLLPITLRRCKVHHTHLIHVGWYALVPLLLIPIFSFLGLLCWLCFPVWYRNVTFQLPFFTLSVALLLNTFWWYAMLRNHLRIPNAIWIVLSMILVTFLVLLLIYIQI
ncbi:MAG: hypothetical protein P8J45_01145 [Phycisphaerales bacterium]|nr:hypothetical protein [Phycisphaerales bacterium]